MKKLNFLLATMMLIAASLVACNNDEVDNTKKPGPNVVPEPAPSATFVFTNVTATMTDVTYTVTPSNDDATYLVFVKDMAAVNECEDDAAIIEMLYTEVEEYATANNTTFNDYLAGSVKQGAITDGKIGNLAYGTDYYLLVFSVDVNSNYEATSDVHPKRFKTAAPDASACTFTVKSTVTLNNVALKVTPSVSTEVWHLINLPLTEYQKYTAADGEYKYTQQQFFQYYLNSEVEKLQGEGLTEQQISNKLFHTGTQTLNASGLEPETKYEVLVGAVGFIDGKAYLTSATTKELRYTTGKADENDLTFDIEVYNIDHYSADIKITPSNPEAEYYYYIGYIDSKKNSMTPSDVANAAVTEYIYYWDENNQLARREPSKGVVDLTGENMYELNIAETEYFIVAFSFNANPTYGTIIDEENSTYDSNPGTITSTPVYVSFKTPEHGDPMNAEFSFITSEVGPYDFNLEVVASDPTIYYLPGIEKAEDFDGQEKMSAYAGFLAQQIQMCMEGQSPSLTIQEALEMKCSSFFRNGSGKYGINNCEPDTEYICYVLAIDVKTGTFAKCYASEVATKTAEVGSVNPTIEILGVYNGDHEAGEIFGDAEATAGRPIVAVKHNNIVGATALYTYITTDEVETHKDQYIISEYRGYWNEVESLTVPYYFFIAQWDIDQTVVSYAQDANGAEGKVARLPIKPNEVNDIAELRAYVEEYNNAITPVAPAKSMVVATENTPIIECIWSEEVGAPRDAEVTYHKVEPATIANDLVSIKVIKSFHI